jgi:hypothetical protein
MTEHRYVEDVLTVRVGDLHLKPNSRRDEEPLVLERPVVAAVGCRWTTGPSSGTVTLRHGRSTGTFQVVSRAGRLGKQWFFTCPMTGKQVISVYFSDGAWGSRRSLSLDWKSHHLSRRKRLLLRREKTVRELADLIARQPQRRYVLEERLESIRHQLEHA